MCIRDRDNKEPKPAPKNFLERWWDELDADEVFSYDTPKTLRMLDRRLGLINLVGRTIIWLYVIGFVLLYDGQMFETAPGYGPTMVKVVNDTYAYANVAPSPDSSLAFTAFDSVDVVNPFLESGASFILTSLEKQQAQRMVGGGGGEADASPDRRLLAGSGSAGSAQGVSWQPAFGQGSTVYDLEGVENFKIRYYATMSFPSVDPVGSTTYESHGGFVGNATIDLGTNAITVEELLSEAGLHIETVKDTGAILQVNLVWECLLLLPQIFGRCKPEFQVVPLDGQNQEPGFFLWRTRHYVKDGEAVRDLEKMIGIRMLWRSVGTGRQLDLFSIIFHIAAGVTLLPIAAMVTEAVMWNILPERKHYERSLYTETPDFYAIDEALAEKEERLRRAKEENTAVDVEALFSAGMDDEDDMDSHGLLQ
eukprot:TRINITY_DN2047_c0_g1_i3.p1 TRINITY_DN2047_c0_g1~~TRINITY_DN2047_c0_g1_i3.p1  ORF type:complete len:422 (+),score=94.76 TRINITY_DN2047_c0_g1_i3:133-1398(+)